MESPLCPPSDAGFRLIETFGYAPGAGCAHAKPHLDRMARSARQLGITFDKTYARKLLQEIEDDVALRCRLMLDRAGQIALTTAEMPPGIGVWRLGIAETCLDSRDPWLRYKTTQRQLYDTARANMPEGVDELIFLNERDEVCEGTITNIFVQLHEGGHYTPPVSCGLLPGVLRQGKLDNGQYQERVLTLDDLRCASFVGVGNSLRGLCRAVLV